MSIKRGLLLATMTLSAIAFAIPATASATTATVWTHEGEVLTTNATTSLEGFRKWVTPLGSFECIVEMHLVLQGKAGGSHTGTVEDITFDTSSCTGSALLTECALVDDGSETLPWVVHITTGSSIHITEASIWQQYATREDPHEPGEECPIEEAHLTLPVLTAEPDDKEAISFVDIGGEGICHVFGLEIGCETEGRLFATEPETYGSKAA